MKIQFEKKYDKDAVEPKWRDAWKEQGTYDFNFQSDRPTYVVDTPPPYVSADHLHSGHIMSFSQAEFIVRFKRMQGYNVFYPMGFDDNGLPTERFVEKKYNIDKSKTTKKEFVELCLQETAKGSETYRNLWNSIGLSVDWSKTYSSINPTATKVSQWSLIDLHKKGHLERKEQPILWCTFCQTALAQADLEDKEEESFMNTIAFHDEKGNELLIATTRPELIPAVVAVYAHPEDERFAHLKDTKITVPLFNYEVPMKFSEAVIPEKGTGLMMVSTWGDVEDVEKWQLDKLDTRQVIGEDGKLNELADKYEGHDWAQARQIIIDDLKELGLLKKQEPLKHAVNTHERCGTAANFLASKQWFIKVADKKETWLEQGRKINWYPEHFRNEYEIWVKGLKWDWCISRQRFYGVPLPMWYCTGCDEAIFAEESQLPVEPSETKPPVDACPTCQGTEFIPESDVMDTWATSSCTPFLLQELVDTEEEKQAMWPTSLRPNAHEIIRTWDFYSIVKAYYNFGTIPFKDVMISGHGLDKKGRKISKRLGNFTPSDELLAEHGADSIRFWATGANLGENLRFQPNEIAVGRKTINKLWNVAKLIAMHAEEYDPQGSYEKDLEPVDLWIMSRRNETVKKVTEYLERYEFAHAKQALAEFFWSDLADRYIEFVKYRLWGEEMTSKHAAVDTLYRVFYACLQMYAPFMPFITEEIHHTMYAEVVNNKSIHTGDWPTQVTLTQDYNDESFQKALEAIDEIRKYKSEQQLSLGAELESYTLQTTIEEAHHEFVKNVMRVQELT